MTNFTPGPWHVGDAKSGRRYIYANDQTHPLKPEVKLNKFGITKEMVANIYLMAASFDLYGALKELFEVAADDPLPLSVRIRVMRAIEKAEEGI